MENEKDLNKDKILKREMEKKEKKILEGLRYFIRHTRKQVEDFKKDAGRVPVFEIEPTLLESKYISYDEYDSNTHDDKEHYITHVGWVKMEVLREEYRKDLSSIAAIVGIISFVISLVVLYFTGISQGWWIDFLGIAKP